MKGLEILSHVLKVRISATMRQKIDYLAQRKDVTASEIVREALIQAVNADNTVSHPVGDTTEPGTITTDATGRAIWVRSGKLVALGNK